LTRGKLGLYGARDAVEALQIFDRRASALTHFICMKRSGCNTIDIVAGNRVII